jgi:hypothetical protein
VRNVGDAPEQEDPKTQVIFYNLAFFIKTRPKLIQAKDGDVKDDE